MLHNERLGDLRSRRNVILALMVVVASLGATAAASAHARAAKTRATATAATVKIAYFVTELGNPYTEADINGAKAIAAKENASVEVFNANFNPQTQLSQCEDAVTSGQYQALEISPVVGTVMKSCVAQAAAKHIKVVAVDAPLGPAYITLKPQMSGVTGSVFQTDLEQGSVELQLIVAGCKSHPKCQVGLMIGSAALSGTPFIERPITRGLERHYPGIKIVATAAGDYTEAGGQAAAQDMLAAHPGINVLATFADQMALGAQKVLQTKGELKKILLTGNGGSTNAATATCAGYWIGTVNPSPYYNGYIGAKILIAQARGGHPQSEVDAATTPAINSSNCAHTKSLHLFTIAG